jgi:hypothetical protein
VGRLAGQATEGPGGAGNPRWLIEILTVSPGELVSTAPEPGTMALFFSSVVSLFGGFAEAAALRRQFAR